jgi:hypothetical protein
MAGFPRQPEEIVTENGLAAIEILLLLLLVFVLDFSENENENEDDDKNEWEDCHYRKPDCPPKRLSETR